MKKFTLLLCATIILSNFIYAQNFSYTPLKLRGKQPPVQSKNSKGFSVQVASLNPYKSGEFMDLKFSILLQTSELEYGDYFEMTFPEGITPLNGTNPISEGTPEDLNNGQILCYLNPINGQTISWGDDNNDYGGIGNHSGKAHEFVVSVKISASISGEQTIPFTISGDEYGTNPPHEISGEIILKEFPSTPDLSLTASGFIAEYHAVPFDQVKTFSQVTSTVQALVTNKGADLTEAATASVKSTGDYSDIQDIHTPLNYEKSDRVVFSDFVANGLGTETFNYFAAAPYDADSANGFDMAEIEVTETDLIRDNGDIIGHFFVGPKSVTGSVFVINNPDTLNSVTFSIGEVESLFEIPVVIYSMGKYGPENLIANSMPCVITESYTEYTAYFANEVILPAGKYLIGLAEGEHKLNLAMTSDPYTEKTAWINVQNQWYDGDNNGFPFTFYIRPGFGTETPDFDIELADLDLYDYMVKDTDIQIEGHLKLQGATPLTTIDIAYILNDEAPVVQSLSGSVAGYFKFSLANKFILPTLGEHKLRVYISNPNGEPDANQKNDTIDIVITAIPYAPEKRVLTEEATSTSCGMCPQGLVIMNSMEKTYPDTWIGIAIHQNDPMEVSEYASKMPDAPGVLINRTEKLYTGEMELGYDKSLKRPSPVELSLKNIVLDKVNQEVSFDLEATFLATLQNARFNAVVMENNVTGPSPGYDQANDYSGSQIPMGGFENKPNPVPAAMLNYDHVARALLGGWEGTENSISTEVNNGDTETYTYTFKINENWTLEDLEIVGMVIAENGAVLNSIKNKYPVGIFTQKQNAEVFDVYPNPSNGEFTVDVDGEYQAVVFDITGKVVLSTTINKNNSKIDLSDQKSGLYFINLNGKKSYNLKVVISN